MSRVRTFFRSLWRFVVVATLVGIGALLIAALCGWLWYRDVLQDVPTSVDISTLYPTFPSKVETVDGHRLAGSLRTKPARLDQIPAQVISAFLAAEDSEFFFHEAYSTRGILRAAWENYRQQARTQGASTITQQVARRFLSREKSYRRKTAELLLARNIERMHSKTEILHVYLESVYLGHRAEGVSQAAWRYFAKDVGQLTLSEAATLAGIAPAPTNYNPRKSVEAATKRRDHVLGRMHQLGMISDTELADAKNEQIVVRTPSDHLAAERAGERKGALYEKGWTEGAMTLVLPSLPELDRHYAEALQSGISELERRHGHPGAVGTTDQPIDQIVGPTRLRKISGVTRDAITFADGSEISLADHQWASSRELTRHHKRPALLRDFRQMFKPNDAVWTADDPVRIVAPMEFEGAIVSIESATGRPLGSVGSRDPIHDEFHRAWQGCRQPGSVFKPVVYAEAFSQGLTAATMVSDVPVQLDTHRGGVWRPRNADRDFKGYITLSRAFASSRNVPVARLMDHLGASRVVARARKLGIESLIDASSAASLGANCTKPWEVARIYAPFQRSGFRVDIAEFDSVLSSAGDVVEEHGTFAWPTWNITQAVRRAITSTGSTRAVSEKVAYIVREQLRHVVTRGTAHDLPDDWPVAGKTGTTNKYDAWFVGFDDMTTTAVWVGSNKNTRALGRGEHGATVALPIFQTAYAPFVRTDWDADPPDGVSVHRIDPQTGLLAPAQEFGLEYTFVDGSEPTEFAPNFGAKQSQRIDELIHEF